MATFLSRFGSLISSSFLNNWKRLNDLIRNGNLDKVLQYIRRMNITPELFENVHQEQGNLNDTKRSSIATLTSPVCLAATLGHVHIMTALVDMGYRAFDLNPSGRSNPWPIHEVCAGGHLDVARTLIDAYHVDVGPRDNNNETPLYGAVRGGHVGMVNYLVESGASVNMPHSSQDYFSPLHVAVKSPGPRQMDVCDVLLKHGAEVNARDKWGRTPLFLLVLDSPGRDGITPDEDTRYPEYRRPDDYMNLIRLLCSRGADPDMRNKSGATPLFTASLYGKVDIVYFLAIERNASLDLLNTDHMERPFCQDLIARRQILVLQTLIEAGYDVVTRDMYWVEEDMEEVVDLLRERFSEPRSLVDLCCFKVRSILGQSLPSVVDTLPVDTEMKDLIQLTHVPNVSVEECESFDD